MLRYEMKAELKASPYNERIRRSASLTNFHIHRPLLDTTCLDQQYPIK